MKEPKGSFFVIFGSQTKPKPSKVKYLPFLIAIILLQACTTASKNPVVETVYQDTIQTDTTAVFQDRSVAIDSLALVKKNFPYIAKYKFGTYKAPLFNGKPAAPDFRGNPFSNDPEYVEFITKGCKRGINFGGHYTLIERSCGAMCSHLFMVDRRTGKIFTDTMGLKEEDGYYGFTYKKDSNLLITDSSVLTDISTGEGNQYSIMPQVFEWKNDSFVLLE